MPHFVPEPGRPKSYENIRDMILEAAERGPVFVKDMAYYVAPDLQSYLDHHDEFYRRLLQSDAFRL